jgi:hypothetical protein
MEERERCYSFILSTRDYTTTQPHETLKMTTKIN